MAALTWRDVASPDFSGVMRGYQLAGDAITSAGNALSKGVDSYQADAQNTAAAQLAAAASKYTDPKALQAALANGSLLSSSGANPGWLTADAYKVPDNRATTLLAQGTSQQALDHNIAMDPILQAQGKANIASTNASTALTGTQTDYNKRTMNSRVDDQAESLREKKQNFEDSQAATAQTVNAKDISGQAYNGATTKEDYLNNLGRITKTTTGDAVDAPTIAIARQMADTLFPSNGAIKGVNLAPGGTQGAPGTAGAQAQIAGQQLSAAVNPNLGSGSVYTPSSLAALYRKVGANPDEAQKLAAISYAESHGDPHAHNTNASTGDNSYGLSQINMLGSMGPERLAHFGLKSNNDLFDPETNARVALQMVRENGGYNDWSTYKSGAYKEHMDGAAGAASDPTNTDNPNIRAASQIQTNKALSILADAATKTDQNNSPGIQGNYATTQANTTLDLNGAVKQLAEGSFAGISPRVIRQKLNEIITESKKTGTVPVTYATAAAILDNTSDPLTGSGSFFDAAGWNPFRDPSITTNSKAQTAELTKIGEGDAHATVKENVGLSAVSGKIRDALATKIQLENDLFDTQEKARSNPALASLVQTKLDKFNRASNTLEALVNSNKGLGTPDWKPKPSTDVPSVATPNGAAPALAAAIQPTIRERLDAATAGPSIRDRLKGYNATPIDERPNIRAALKKALGVN